VEPEPTSDGAGVRLTRALGTRSLDNLDPFLLLDRFGSENPEEYMAGFPMHPHRGIETVTYMLSGAVRHRDSLGNEGVIEGGDLQWMTAGGGILHEEMPEMRDGRLDGFQLWVNLPARLKMTPPRYQEIASSRIPEVKEEDGTVVRVIAGRSHGVTGAVEDVAADPTYLDVSLPPRTVFRQAVPPDHTVFVFLFQGSVRLSGKEFTADRLFVFGDGDTVEVSGGEEPSRFLLVSGKPLDEPIARYGPVVMNTRQEVMEALKDLEQGTFVK
jgi:quercetin 2,3-dioxygenase